MQNAMNTCYAKIILTITSQLEFLVEGLSMHLAHDFLWSFKDSLRNELQWLIMGKAQMYVCLP